MSVYCSFGDFSDDFGDHPAPLIYRESHIIPRHTDPRGGFLNFGAIPAFLTRNGYDDNADENAWWPYLRVPLRTTTPEDTAVLTHSQIVALRDELTSWLNRVDPDLDPEAQDLTTPV
jgi:hypothetical protein